MEKSKLLILDRDGVINEDSDSFIKMPEEWHAIPGSLEAIARLCREDYHVVVMTNQSGISRELFTINALNRIHQKMMEELNHLGGEISAIFFCPHKDEENCYCRKPQPGMYLELFERTRCNFREIYSVGDSLRDLQAAVAAESKPVLVRTGKGVETEQILKDYAETSATDRNPDMKGLEDVPVYENLAKFVDDLLKVVKEKDKSAV